MASECGFEALLKIYIHVDFIDMYRAGAIVSPAATLGAALSDDLLKAPKRKSSSEINGA